MEKKSISPSAFLSLRALIALLPCASACFMAMGTVPTFSPPDPHAQVPQRTLSFAERVVYQRAIEEVYWRHRIWPKENPDPKPSLGAVMSHPQLEKKVENYLSKSQALEHYWKQPLTAEQLQAEIDRMAKNTKKPEILHELFAALGSDPFLIAECLARPILVERVIADLNAHHQSLAKIRGASAGGTADLVIPRANYELPAMRASVECIDDTWIATSVVNAPEARDAHTTVWTGTEMIVWGGSFVDNSGAHYLNTGARYDPITDSWVTMNTTNAPTARSVHSAVWTGSEMIIWGGYSDATGEVRTGGRYNPITDSWTPTGTTNAPTARVQHTAIWSGNEMIVWGGYGCGGNCNLNTGGQYNPTTDNWVAISTINAPSARWYHRAMWTGSEMIIWGGTDGTNYLNTGGRYNPKADGWTATAVPNAVRVVPVTRQCGPATK